MKVSSSKGDNRRPFPQRVTEVCAKLRGLGSGAFAS